jgi:hypothetical protein
LTVVVSGLDALPDNRNMAIAKFPTDMAQAVGRFWIPGDESPTTSDGLCNIDAEGITIEVTEHLTPAHETVQVANGIGIRQAPEPDNMVIHGTIPFEPRHLTFFDAWTRTRHGLRLPFGDIGDGKGTDPQLHGLSAAWCIAGAHIPSPASTFDAFRVRFTHLELWAGLSGIEMKVMQKPVEVSMTFQPPKDVTVPFTEFDEEATLRLSTTGTVPRQNVWGGQIRTENWLAVEGLSGWTLAEIFERFIQPVRALLTILAGERCEILVVEVKVDEAWCAVFGASVKGQTERPADDRGQMLLTRESMPLDRIASWCATSALLTPTPHVIAAALAGAFQTVETEALALTTTAEGMDSALYPGSRRFSDDDVKKTKKALKALRKSKDSEAPAEVINELSSALGTYLYKDSYPMRMKRLAAEVSVASPDCVGDPDEWKDAMRQLRNDLAHSNRDARDDDDARILAIYETGRSLRWALQVRLLQHAGVPSDVLSTALESSRRFKRDAERWQGRFEKETKTEDLADELE